MLGEDLLSAIAEKNKNILFFHLFCMCFTLIFIIFFLVEVVVYFRFDQQIEYKLSALMASIGGVFFSTLLYLKARYYEKNQDEK